MLDIAEVQNGQDLKLLNTAAPRAGNVLSIQIGSLEYAPTFGVDYKYFIESDFQFQNESFKAYLVQRITEHQINVAQVTDTLESIYSRITFSVGDANVVGRSLL